ncbi:CaiB/BaiF CoA transferase family protein [Modicisalibacter coralii]|uniref:CaiB/BaiF CoA transferase family protein n=1 Tax=Modicisalibacter coralii TaxID=2304602 RepID=UPI00100B13DA|nr:CaiB/BaiF CoA-transferase family protein [Halomonas coralii]
MTVCDETLRKPLAGIRVLDLSRVLAGPWCTQQLADLGAEVIKIERPGRGDDTRGWGPPWLDGTTESAYFLSANRGKRSVTIDLARPEGQALVRRLAADSDVLIENFKVGGLAAYGLDAASLCEANPRLVYCSITGFGQDGPYASRAGYDFLIQGMGGLMSVTGQPDGEPTKVGVAFVDIFTGLYAANAILAALHRRETTGRGGHIDMALLDVQVGVLANQALNYLTSGRNPERLGNAHPNIVPYQAFATADGHLILAVGNDDQFRRLCEVLGMPGLADDARFATNAAHVAHRETLVPLLDARLRGAKSVEWLAAMEAAGVPCGPINRLDAVFDDPQVRHRGLRIERCHAAGEPMSLVGNPIRLDGQRLNAERAPPRLGEHTDAVLAERLGLDPAALAALHESGVLGRPDDA